MPANRLVSIITGAGKLGGIGAATALKLASTGHNVMIHYRSNAEEATKVANACKEYNVEATICQADLSTEEGCQTVVRQTISGLGYINHLVNNAGTTQFATLAQLNSKPLSHSINMFENLFKTNLYGPFMLSMMVAPYMKGLGGGSITNISSMAGITANGSSAPYSASKAALNNITTYFAREFTSDNIRVNAVCPGVVDSTWWQKRFQEQSKLLTFMQGQQAKSPLHRVLTPEDVASSVLHLINSEYITGKIDLLDAGTQLGAPPPPPKEAESSKKSGLIMH